MSKIKECAADDCQATFEAMGARKFCDAHQGEKKPTRSQKEKREPAKAELYVVSIDVSEGQLNNFWNTLPIEQKGLAVQNYLDATREEA